MGPARRPHPPAPRARRRARPAGAVRARARTDPPAAGPPLRRPRSGARGAPPDVAQGRGRTCRCDDPSRAGALPFRQATSSEHAPRRARPPQPGAGPPGRAPSGRSRGQDRQDHGGSTLARLPGWRRDRARSTSSPARLLAFAVGEPRSPRPAPARGGPRLPVQHGGVRDHLALVGGLRRSAGRRKAHRCAGGSAPGVILSPKDGAKASPGPTNPPTRRRAVAALRLPDEDPPPARSPAPLPGPEHARGAGAARARGSAPHPGPSSEDAPPARAGPGRRTGSPEPDTS